jgi:uncharacterized membrane protein YsdA (DUF1294 family)/cold shock CspA family protein
MSNRGRITRWKDERGFGFIESSVGGDQAFVHISSFENRGQRPQNDDLVTYSLKRDREGRLQAVRVRFADDTKSRRSESKSVLRAMVVSAAFFSVLGTSVVMGILPPGLISICMIMSGIAFMTYWYDKSASRTGGWRTRESTLHVLGILGGWPGALVAMQVFRHKSSKQSFRSTFWTTVLMNCGVLIWLATPMGSFVLRSVTGAT